MKTLAGIARHGKVRENREGEGWAGQGRADQAEYDVRPVSTVYRAGSLLIGRLTNTPAHIMG